MKNILRIMSFGIMFLLIASPASAAPFKADKNPNIVANYEDGPHGIPGESEYHEGKDVVMAAGKSGNFQQWFYGYSAEDGGIIEGDHSVWKLSKDGSCPDNSFAMTVTGPDGDNFWGDYLEYGSTYCIHTNDFRVSK